MKLMVLNERGEDALKEKKKLVGFARRSYYIASRDYQRSLKNISITCWTLRSLAGVESNRNGDDTFQLQSTTLCFVGKRLLHLPY